MNQMTFLLGIAMFVSGCSTYSGRCAYVRERYGCEYGRQSLYDCAHSNVRPVRDCAYTHNGQRLQVFQVLDSGVLVRINEPKYARTRELWDGSIVTTHDDDSHDLELFVETSNQYVDKEFLYPGLYQYTGTYSYKAVDGTNKTLRRFKQLE